MASSIVVMILQYATFYCDLDFTVLPLIIYVNILSVDQPVLCL